MDDLLKKFRARMAELDITADPGLPGGAVAQTSPTTFELSRGASRQQYDVVSAPALRYSDIAESVGSSPGRRVFVWTNYVSTRAAETFRHAGIQFADRAGNVWLTFGDVMIDIRGRRPTVRTTPRSSVAGNLFSTRRAQVVFALLTWPQLWHATNREISTASGVSLGLTHDALTLLANEGYGGSPRRPELDALLDRWTAAFPTGLSRRIELATYHGEIDDVRPPHKNSPLLIGGEYAAREFLRPTALTLYVRSLDEHLPIVNRWRSDGEPNIVVRKRFWTDPDGAIESATGLGKAPWTLVYADLATSEDARVREVARTWRERFARPDSHA